MSENLEKSHLGALSFRSPFFWALLTTALCALAIGAGIAFGWPGAIHPCVEPPYCFCERVRLGPIGQPANTWSNLGFVSAGLWIGWDALRRIRIRIPNSNSNSNWPQSGGDADLYLADPRYPALYASVVVFLGPGSMFFHGAMTEWGGRVDGFSMYLFILYVVAFAVGRGRGWDFGRFATLYAVLVVIFGIERGFALGGGTALFGNLVTVALGLEIWLALPRSWGALGRVREFDADRRWLWLGVAFFASAFVVWWLSDSGRPLCDPDSWIQGHAVWHLLSAACTAALYRYAVSERTRPGTGELSAS